MGGSEVSSCRESKVIGTSPAVGERGSTVDCCQQLTSADKRLASKEGAYVANEITIIASSTEYVLLGRRMY